MGVLGQPFGTTFLQHPISLFVFVLYRSETDPFLRYIIPPHILL